MATKALPPGAVHRRALFGALDADGWIWASLKAFIWFILLIVLLGYIPDRAYYFTVGRTVEIDAPILLWSPINLCPAENQGLPCPAPVGAVVPWAAPQQLALPAPRTNGAAAQIATHLLYIGGTDGKAPTTTTYVAEVKDGNVAAWGDGPALPEARADAGYTVLSGAAYLVGGNGPDGKPTDTVWTLPTTGDKADLGTWAPVKDLTLPEPRSGAVAVAVTDGILVAGGRGADGAPSNKVWKSTTDSKGVLGAFKEQAPLATAVADANAVLVGEFIWIYGGSDANGPTPIVQSGHFGAPGVAPGASGAPAGSGPPVATPAPAATTTPVATETPVASIPEASATPSPEASAALGGSSAPAASQGPAPTAAPAAAAAPAPAASGAPQPLGVQQWNAGDALKLPAPRTGGADFTANGAIYLAGGSDAAGPRSELYWAIPDSNGGLTDGWHHLSNDDLSAPVTGASPVVSGSNAILLGGTGAVGPQAAVNQASLAPQSPFFQLGLFGVVIPALQIPGEIGQQLGYLSAAGAGTVNFVILILLGYVFNHKEQVSGWISKRRNRGRPVRR
jgi:hypothetical protein